jgi:pilus assembly protein CpaF
MGYDMPVLAIRQQLAAAIDVIVHLGRLRDNSRRVLEISEIAGVENGEIKLHPLYQFQETGEQNGKVCGSLVKMGEIRNKTKLMQSGLWKEAFFENKKEL